MASQIVCAQCESPEKAQTLLERLYGIGPRIGRWQQNMKAVVDPQEPSKVYFEIPDYQGPHDLTLVNGDRGIQLATVTAEAPVKLLTHAEDVEGRYISA